MIPDLKLFMDLKKYGSIYLPNLELSLAFLIEFNELVTNKIGYLY